jgi:hypothetical protein
VRVCVCVFSADWARSLRGVRLDVPEAVLTGDTARLACDYDLEHAALYSIKWYRGDDEFYRFVPKESPPTRVFPLPGINVDVSSSHNTCPLCGIEKCARFVGNRVSLAMNH